MRAAAQAPAPFKLPIFYVMDSLLKNIGGVYVPLFGVDIVDVFGAAFSVVRHARARARTRRRGWQWASHLHAGARAPPDADGRT